MVFVTGGTGLLGAQLLLDLVKRDKDVRAMKRQTSDLGFVRSVFEFEDSASLFDRIEWVDGDLLDVLGLEELIQGCEVVYHCAATVSFNKKDEEKMMEANIGGTANIVNACIAAGVKKLSYASSIAVFGREPNRGIVTEEAQWKRTPYNSPYAISKYGAEREVWRGTEEGLDAVIVNPSVIFGPCEWDKSSGVIFKSVQDGMPFYTLGTNGFVDVRDVSKAMIELADGDIRNERFILNGKNLVFRDMLNLVADALGKKRPYIYARPWMTGLAWRAMAVKAFLTGSAPTITKDSVRSAHMNSHYSSERIKQRLGFEITPVREGIERAAKFLTHP